MKTNGLSDVSSSEREAEDDQFCGITFFLFYKADPISFQLIFQHDVDPVIRQAVKLLVCPVSQVFFSPNVPDIPCNDTGDPLFPAVFCKISCDLVQIVRY